MMGWRGASATVLATVASASCGVESGEYDESSRDITAVQKLVVGAWGPRNGPVFNKNAQLIGDLADPASGNVWGSYAHRIEHSIYLVDQTRSAIWVHRHPDGTDHTTNDDFSLEELIPPGSGGMANPFYVIRRGNELFVASHNTDSVNRYDATTGAFIDQFVPSGSGGLDGTRGIRFGIDGHLYVNSSINSKILKYDGATGAFIGELATLPVGYLNCGMAIRANGDMCVGSAGGQGFACLHADGTTFLSHPSGRVCGTNFGPDGRIYMARPDVQTVEAWDIDLDVGGTWVNTAEPRGVGIEMDD